VDITATNQRKLLPKSLTGIQGLDEITEGGLPKGRPTLICGSAGCGKTLLAMEFLVRGATEFNEPGVFMAFEETAKDLTQNVASMGFDLDALIADKKLVLDFVYIERSEIEETGEYDLDIAVADVVDAMSSHRPYRAALGVHSALAEIERGRGTLYDPAVVDACLTLFREKRYRIPGTLP
jgi:KaiC/GvpD/RAD55 family RecA-like ATPase